ERAVAERAHDPGRDQHEEGGQAAEAEEDEPEEAGRDAPGALALALLEQVAEDGDEGGGEGGVGDERAQRVRDQECDLERIDRADGAEVVACDDLADEAEDPGEAGRRGEDRRRASQAATVSSALRGGRFLLHGHAVSIGSAPVATIVPPATRAFSRYAE